MNQKQILDALKLNDKGTANKYYAAKLQSLCKLIKELKTLNGYGFTMSEAGNVQLVSAMPVLSRYQFTNYTFYTDAVTRQNNCKQIFGAFENWHKITVFHASGSYYFDIPAGTEFTTYIFSLIGANETPAKKVEAEKPLLQIVSGIEVVAKIKTAITYTSKDTLRPAMTGVLMEVTGNNTMVIVGTDAHRLYKSDNIKISTIDNRAGTQFIFTSIIIPYDIAKKIISSKWVGDIEINVYKNTCSFGNIEFTPMDARYPDYDSVINNYMPYKMEIDRSELLTHIAVNMPCANQTTKQVAFSLNGNIKVRCEDIDFSQESKSEFNYISSNVPDMDISFNGKLLTDILKTSKDKTVIFEVLKRDGAAIIRNTSNRDINLLMPLFMGV